MIREHLCSNGMRCIHYVMPASCSSVTSIRAYVAYGSTHETKGTYGISHYLEHILFQGTKRFPTQSILTQTIEGLGATMNATTSKDYTSYELDTDNGKNNIHVKQLLNILFDMLWNSRCKPADIRRERQVVIQELTTAQEDDAEQNENEIYSRFFRGHPLEIPVGAYPEDVEQITPRQMVSEYKKWYVPERIILVIASSIPTVRLVRMIESILRAYRSTDAQPPPQSIVPHVPYVPNLSYMKHPLGIIHVFPQSASSEMTLHIGFRTVPFMDTDRFPLYFLATWLGAPGSMSSVLTTRLRTKHGYVYNVDANHYTHKDGGAFLIQTQCTSKYLEGVLREIADVFREIRDKRILTASDLKNIKQLIRGTTHLNSQTASFLAETIGTAVVLNPSAPIESIDEILEIYDNITVNDVYRVFDLYIRPENMVVSCGGDVKRTARGILRKLLQW